jgi:hypothetical protein
MSEESSGVAPLWQLNRDSHVTRERWIEIIGGLVTSLAEFVERPVAVNEISIEDISDGDTRAVALINSSKPFGGPLSLAWEGALGVELHEDRPYVTVSIFLFCLVKRLSVAEHNAGSYIELMYDPTPDGLGQWKVLGWLKDIYREWEDVDRCSAYDNFDETTRQ